MQNPKFNFSKQQQEVLKCKLDPIYFIEKYIKIFNQRYGIIPFKMYDKQKKFIKLWLKQHKVVILKSRQTGMTTTLQQLQLWLQLFHEHYYIGIISLEQSRQNEFLKGLKEMYYLQDLSWLPVRPIKDIEKRLVFSNQSQIIQGNSNNPFRGYPMQTIIVDEQQFVQNLEEQLNQVGPTLQTIQKSGIPWGIIMNSTPNGMGNYYHEIYINQLDPKEFYQGKDQQEQQNGYVRFRFHWSEVPDYDEEWYKEQCQILGNDPRRIQQELELKFISSGETFISGSILEEIDKHLKDQDYDLIDITVNEEQGISYQVRIYEHPIDNMRYYIGVDPSGGLGKDRSQIVVIREDTQEIVQDFHNENITDEELQNLVYNLQHYYNKQLLGVELSGGYGISLVRKLMNMGYNRFYWSKKINQKKIVEKQNSIKSLSSQNQQDKLPGIVNSQITRPIILNNMKKYITDNPYILKSRYVLEELQVFIYNKKRVEQRSGFHDDLVMQLQFQLFIRDRQLQEGVYFKEDLFKPDETGSNVLSKISFENKNTVQHQQKSLVQQQNEMWRDQHLTQDMLEKEEQINPFENKKKLTKWDLMKLI